MWRWLWLGAKLGWASGKEFWLGFGPNRFGMRVRVEINIFFYRTPASDRHLIARTACNIPLLKRTRGQGARWQNGNFVQASFLGEKGKQCGDRNQTKTHSWKISGLGGENIPFSSSPKPTQIIILYAAIYALGVRGKKWVLKNIMSWNEACSNWFPIIFRLFRETTSDSGNRWWLETGGGDLGISVFEIILEYIRMLKEMWIHLPYS